MKTTDYSRQIADVKRVKETKTSLPSSLPSHDTFLAHTPPFSFILPLPPGSRRAEREAHKCELPSLLRRALSYPALRTHAQTPLFLLAHAR